MQKKHKKNRKKFEKNLLTFHFAVLGDDNANEGFGPIQIGGVESEEHRGNNPIKEKVLERKQKAEEKGEGQIFDEHRLRRELGEVQNAEFRCDKSVE